MPPPMTDQDPYFPSKRDGWIVGLIWGSVLISVVGGMIPLAVSGTHWLEAGSVVAVLAGMDGLMLWVLYGTGYRVTRDQLVIRCGPFSFRVPLQTIASIIPTVSLWSSPACSSDRLQIVYGISLYQIMISPADKAGFLSAIVNRCPSLTLLHDQVWKKAEPTSPVDVRTVQPQGIV